MKKEKTTEWRHR